MNRWVERIFIACILAFAGAALLLSQMGYYPALSLGGFTFQRNDSSEALTGSWSKVELLSSISIASQNLTNALGTPFSQKKSRISRGVAIYFPASEAQQEKELSGHLLSVAYMRSTQPSGMKTDVLVFTPPRGNNFTESLGCTHAMRSSFADREMCRIVQHIPLAERPGIVDPLVSYKRYVDSVLMLAEFRDYDKYDYLLKSDMDTFITPGFANWTLPANKLIATGRGGYDHPNSRLRLSFIMKHTLNLRDEGRSNIGTTWYGSPAVMVAACQLSIASMRWLDRMEFTEYERLHHTTDAWPVWYWPVLTMYGGHIAINQIPKDQVLYQEPGVVEMDYGADAPGELKDSVKHIHCWHSERFFSKFAFANGNYNSMNLTNHSRMDSPASYAAVIALSAVRMSKQELSTINTEGIHAVEWKRLSV